MAPSNKPIINCHTHIFKGDHVPPYLAKTFVMWPFSKILNIPFILWIFKTFINRKNEGFNDENREARRRKIKRSINFHRNIFLKVFTAIIKVYITVHALIIVLEWIGFGLGNLTKFYTKWITDAYIWLSDNQLLFIIKNVLLQILIVATVFLFIKSGRKLIWFIVKLLLRLTALIPGKMTKSLISRYILFGRFTIYKKQHATFSKLVQQYPPGSKFIVLPMDMEYMGAGSLKKENQYKAQMEELANIKQGSTNKDAFLPFVFVDPRRLREDNGQLKYTIDETTGTVTLQSCFIKDYIEHKKFSGFKIYPPLGYYPFDETLLPLWKYAADNQVPIMTHCIKGTIFYRGKKKKEWDQHPVFKEHISLSPAVLEPLLLPDQKNVEFANNFTHPLNYLVLLKEELLRVLVSNASKNIKELFGFTDVNTKLKRDLSHLKICMAHFGGEDQWQRYLELDRYNYSTQLIQNPDKGINFYNKNGDISWKKLEDCWKYVDWYSIICSMMLQHDNVYADISYILHDDEIVPLLKQTINNPKLGKKILFGTDFFVVRNHSSEKDLLTSITGNLTTEEFDKIARDNPEKFLK